LKVKKMELFCLSKSVPANRDCAWHPHGRYMGIEIWVLP